MNIEKYSKITASLEQIAKNQGGYGWNASMIDVIKNQQVLLGGILDISFSRAKGKKREYWVITWEIADRDMTGAKRGTRRPWCQKVEKRT